MRVPQLSIIVPTRERAETLQYTLVTVLDQKSDAFELLVSDNASQDNTRMLVQAIQDSRVRYVNTGRRVSMCDNWDFALEQARGEFVLFIGDDDGVVPGAIGRLLNAMVESPSQAYFWPKPMYRWPGQNSPAHIISSPREANPRVVQLAPIAHHVVRRAGARWHLLPSVYHGAISVQVLNWIREQTGRVFHSTQPDVFTTLAIPVFVQEAINLGFPVTVFGFSSHSNSATVYGQGGKQTYERFVKEFEGYRIHATLFPGVPPRVNHIPDTVLVARDLFPAFYGNDMFSYEAMWAAIIRSREWHGYDITTGFVLSHASEIRKYHSLNTSKFLLHLYGQKLMKIYRDMTDHSERSAKARGDHLPADIVGFAHSFSSSES